MPVAPSWGAGAVLAIEAEDVYLDGAGITNARLGDVLGRLASGRVAKVNLDNNRITELGVRRLVDALLPPSVAAAYPGHEAPTASTAPDPVRRARDTARIVSDYIRGEQLNNLGLAAATLDRLLACPTAEGFQKEVEGLARRVQQTLPVDRGTTVTGHKSRYQPPVAWFPDAGWREGVISKIQYAGTRADAEGVYETVKEALDGEKRRALARAAVPLSAGADEGIVANVQAAALRLLLKQGYTFDYVLYCLCFYHQTHGVAESLARVLQQEAAQREAAGALGSPLEERLKIALVSRLRQVVTGSDPTPDADPPASAVEDLRLAGNHMGDAGALHVVRLLRFSETLVKLHLSRCSLSDASGLVIADVLKGGNDTLRELDVAGNSFTDGVGVAFVEVFAENRAITALRTEGNLIAPEYEALIDKCAEANRAGGSSPGDTPERRLARVVRSATAAGRGAGASPGPWGGGGGAAPPPVFLLRLEDALLRVRGALHRREWEAAAEVVEGLLHDAAVCPTGAHRARLLAARAAKRRTATSDKLQQQQQEVSRYQYHHHYQQVYEEEGEHHHDHHLKYSEGGEQRRRRRRKDTRRAHSEEEADLRQDPHDGCRRQKYWEEEAEEGERRRRRVKHSRRRIHSEEDAEEGEEREDLAQPRAAALTPSAPSPAGVSAGEGRRAGIQALLRAAGAGGGGCRKRRRGGTKPRGCVAGEDTPPLPKRATWSKGPVWYTLRPLTGSEKLRMATSAKVAGVDRTDDGRVYKRYRPTTPSLRLELAAAPAAGRGSVVLRAYDVCSVRILALCREDPSEGARGVEAKGKEGGSDDSDGSSSAGGAVAALAARKVWLEATPTDAWIADHGGGDDTAAFELTGVALEYPADKIPGGRAPEAASAAAVARLVRDLALAHGVGFADECGACLPAAACRRAAEAHRHARCVGGVWSVGDSVVARVGRRVDATPSDAAVLEAVLRAAPAGNRRQGEKKKGHAACATARGPPVMQRGAHGGETRARHEAATASETRRESAERCVPAWGDAVPLIGGGVSLVPREDRSPSPTNEDLPGARGGRLPAADEGDACVPAYDEPPFDASPDPALFTPPTRDDPLAFSFASNGQNVRFYVSDAAAAAGGGPPALLYAVDGAQRPAVTRVASNGLDVVELHKRRSVLAAPDEKCCAKLRVPLAVLPAVLGHLRRLAAAADVPHSIPPVIRCYADLAAADAAAARRIAASEDRLLSAHAAAQRAALPEHTVARLQGLADSATGGGPEPRCGGGGKAGGALERFRGCEDNDDDDGADAFDSGGVSAGNPVPTVAVPTAHGRGAFSFLTRVLLHAFSEVLSLGADYHTQNPSVLTVTEAAVYLYGLGTGNPTFCAPIAALSHLAASQSRDPPQIHLAIVTRKPAGDSDAFVSHGSPEVIKTVITALRAVYHHQNGARLELRQLDTAQDLRTQVTLPDPSQFRLQYIQPTVLDEV
ncbi:hypothetical protein DIPPA_08174 [Diplonema papillatum]|nr:hypothetical protein DIPPA_08174 [Diplonema papillatum]